MTHHFLFALASGQIDWNSPLFSVFVFLAGACIGSFLNVCIYRIPLDLSVVKPRSYCASCGAPIPGYYNIPIVSWFVLKGRAACCGTRIDRRYWIIEAFTGLVFLLLWQKYHLPLFIPYAIFAAGLIVASGIDIDHFIIPDRFTIGGCVAGLILSALFPAMHGRVSWTDAFGDSFRGAIIGGLALWLVATVGRKVFGKEAMGFGDVKFIAAMGSFLGLGSILFIVASSAFIGSVFGLYLILGKQGSWGSRMPYGPFLAGGALLWLLGGAEMNHAYWQHIMETARSVPSP